MLRFDDLILYSNLQAIFKIVSNIAPAPLKKVIQLCSGQTT